MVKVRVEEIRDDFEYYYHRTIVAAMKHVEELAEDIRKNGLQTPIEIHKTENGYEIVNGIHRFRAVKLLGWKEVECSILDHGPQAHPYPVGRYEE
jgi:hypothetical protein